MKKVALSVVTAFVFFVAMAVAQTSTPQTGTQGNESSSPGMQQGTETQSNTGQMKHQKGMKEHTLRGCVESENGTYKLQEKSGKEITLTGSDVAAHVGHEVKVKGMWEKAGATEAGESSASSGMGKSAAGHEFNVTSVQMISSSCPMEKGEKGKAGSTSSQTPPPQK